jgi:drug/metabolite transporter (DMT)-like permease
MITKEILKGPLLLFIMPILSVILGVFVFIAEAASEYSGVFAAILLIIAFVSALIAALFLVINKNIIKWQMQWWQYLLVQFGIIFVTIVAIYFGVSIR